MSKKFLRELAHDVFYAYSGRDTDHPTCPKCGGTMTFHGGERELGEGYWDCDGCSYSFTEADLDKYVD